MACVHMDIERGLARIALDRPPLNVIDLESAGEIATAIESAAARPDVAVIALQGRGKAFCAGVDVRDHLPDRGEAMLRGFHRIALALLHAPQPTVAIVHGAALGGGCELTLVCDLVLASERATFGQPEIRLGVFPPVAAALLPRMIPAHVAAELLLTGRIVTAAEAARIGLANRVVEESALAGAVDSTLADLLALSPASLRTTKRALRHSRGAPHEQDIRDAEAFYLEHLLHAPEAIEGLTAFLEKRSPRWGGREEDATRP